MPTPPPWWMDTQEAPEAVDQGVQHRPVGDRVRAVRHGLGLPVRRGDRAAVQVVAADDDGGLQLAVFHHLVEAEPRLLTLAVAEPADPCRKALELHLLLGQPEPPGQGLILREQVDDGPVGAAMSLGSPDRATQRNGPLPSQNSGLM